MRGYLPRALGTMHPERPQFLSRSIGFREFLVLTAAVMACQALAVDTMLPALPTIAHDLGVTDQNDAQWVITTYIAGVGIGQLFWGMLSDRFGRRRVLLIGLTLYVAAAAGVGLAGNFTALLAWRFVHGVAAASMVVSRSVIRDLYGGRQMARERKRERSVCISISVQLGPIASHARDGPARDCAGRCCGAPV